MFARLALLAPLFAVAPASAADTCVDVEFTPTDSLQIAAWVEDSAGNYQATVFVTQQTGSFGLGNRPGRFDFNSGPLWPYGRRITALPVWAYAQGQLFPTVIFQSSPDDPNTCFQGSGELYAECGENNLSHSFEQSSRESHFCRPMQEGEPGWDAMTCATIAYTDKGMFSMSTTTPYPPRTDVIPQSPIPDSPSVAMYKAMNPFDAVSQATPVGGAPANITFPVPTNWPPGDYVLMIETSKENDDNTTYNATSYPSPSGISWSEYGVAYRGQPSIVYKVPFTIGTTVATTTTSSYAGYGDPNGADGNLRAPDATITTDTPGSGASRLQLVSDNGTMYRVRVDVTPNVSVDIPGAPAALQSTTVGGSSAQFSFVAPGIGAAATQVSGYDIRIRATDAMTADNFDASMPVSASVTPLAPGQLQTFELDALLPETDYWVGIRAYDGCHNPGDLTILAFTTTAPASGEVDACFIATAAYGSMMANDVELLRHFRDSLLESTVLGELAVESYYTFGPAVAGVVGESELLRSSARDLLAPIVARVRKLSF